MTWGVAGGGGDPVPVARLGNGGRGGHDTDIPVAGHREATPLNDVDARIEFQARTARDGDLGVDARTERPRRGAAEIHGAIIATTGRAGFRLAGQPVRNAPVVGRRRI